jgi:hypothetical protein
MDQKKNGPPNTAARIEWGENSRRKIKTARSIKLGVAYYLFTVLSTYWIYVSYRIRIAVGAVGTTGKIPV